MSSTLVKAAAMSVSALVLVGVAACSSQPSTPQTPQDVYLSAFNKQASELGAPKASPGSSFEQQVIGYGHDFCATFTKNGYNDAAAQKAIVTSDGIPSDLAGAVFLAATAKGSLCPVG